MHITELLQRHFIPYRASVRPNELWVNCPFCEERGEPSPDTKFRLGLNYHTGQGHCFRCDWASHNSAVIEVAHKITGNSGIQFESQEEEKKEVEKIALPLDFELLSKIKIGEDELETSAFQYMKQRGINRHVMASKKIGFSLSGRYAYRIVFPVYWLGKLRGIVARDFTGSSVAKYINSPGEKYLYNLSVPSNIVVLSEGIFKALAIERAVPGITSAALLGHSITSLMIKQLSYLKDLKEVVIWPDPDKVGLAGALDVADQLQELTRVTIISPVPSKQADELSSAEILHRFKARIPYSRTVHRQHSARLAFGGRR